MMEDYQDPLEALGLDYSYGELEDSTFQCLVENYSMRQREFRTFMNEYRKAMVQKFEAQAVASFTYPEENDPQSLADFYQQISDFCKSQESESWNFNHIEVIPPDLEHWDFDYDEPRTEVVVWAYVKTTDQPTTLEQIAAKEQLLSAKEDLDYAVERLNKYFKENK